ncbi:hypothetical protein [Streptococcus hyovaginalis]|uniref:hypothetical protein n=1 Tax=Streptococcus hyovaginalis TaxID=149015 RepID=UPI00147929E4|nr:hypothetical protein [Streptococcus hyovaginalis]
MKFLVKSFLNKLIWIVALLAVIAAGVFYVIQRQNGKVEQEYQFVIKRFSKQSQLVVADAGIETKAHKTFESKAMKDWPKWTESIQKVFVNRELNLEIPVKTEFKLELKDLSKTDVNIKDNTLTFKRPLTVNVDSQQVGNVVIKDTKSGVVDKAVDLVTSNKKSQEFLTQKSTDALEATSKKIMSQKDKREKVAKYSEEALENILNLNSDEKITVKISESDLQFVNVDSKEK